MRNSRGDSMKLDKDWYGTYEAARILGIHPSSLWNWCKEGKIKAWRTPGGRYKIPKQELERLLKEAKGE